MRDDAITVYFVARDPRTPISVKLLALAVGAYALSPVDLIPDFIPVLGYLDDLILLPLGILLVLKLAPEDVLAVSRKRAREALAKPRSRFGVVLIVGIWLFCLVSFGYLWWLR